MKLRILLAAIACAIAAHAPAYAQVEASRNMTLLAQRNDYPYLGAGRGYSSCWSYVHSDGREFAVIGYYDGTAIYEVTDPLSAPFVAFIPGPPSIWRNMKSYRDWIYIVTEGFGAGRGLQIVRMTDPDHPVLAATYTGSFVASHTVTVDSTKALLVCNGTRNGAFEQTGTVILSIADPEAPVELFSWPGGLLTGVDSLYVHDSVIRGDRLFLSCVYAGEMHVLDIADPLAPVEPAAWSYPGGFTHNSWPDESGNWLYVTDEARGEPLKVFDIANLAAPVLANRVTSNWEAVIHNVYVHGDEAYLANFSEGTRILDIRDPAHPAEFAWADTWPGETGFSSIWNVCPYFPSGIVIASDRQSGLYVFRPERDYGTVRVEVSLDGVIGGGVVVGAGVRAGAGPDAAVGAITPTAPGASVGGVLVRLVEQGDSLYVPADGVVRFAPDPGPHTLRASAFGYHDAEMPVLVTSGVDDTLVIALASKPRLALAGTVHDAFSLTGLDDAEVELEHTPLHAHADGAGAFDFGLVPEDVYDVTVRCPGYAPLATTFAVDALTPAPVAFPLVPAALWDDLESESGWIVGAPGDAGSAGVWTRVAPLGTGVSATAGAGGTALALRGLADPIAAPEHGEENGAVRYPGEVQPGEDRTPGAGTMCFVTGQGTNPIDIWENSVTGRTTLTSPPLDLTALGDPAIGFWRWLYSDGGDEGWLAILVSGDDGATWAEVDTLRGFHNHWEETWFRVADHVAPGPAVRVRFVADGAGAAVVEAAVDDLTAWDLAAMPLGAGSAPAPARLAMAPPRPNPARGTVTFAVAVPAAGALAVEVFDAGGRRVRRLEQAVNAAGTVTVRWDGRDAHGLSAAPGVYVVRARFGGEQVARRVARVR